MHKYNSLSISSYIVTLTIPVNANAELVLLYKTLVLEKYKHGISMVKLTGQTDGSNRPHEFIDCTITLKHQISDVTVRHWMMTELQDTYLRKVPIR